MKAPKYIYVTTSGLNPLHHPWGCWTTRECDGIKYIRADLAELTWEDIKKIELLLFALECSSVRPYRGEDLYEEVLRRFLESKKEVK